MVEGATYLRGSTLAVAFNVKIKKTLEERIGHFATCRTLNGLGHRAMVGFFGRKVRIDRDKVHALLMDLFKKEENEKLWEIFAPVKRMGRSSGKSLRPVRVRDLLVRR